MPAYRVIKKLGQGGMGVVYLAEQTSLKREVALKVLTENLRANDSYFSRFLREVQASTRVAHPNIIKIIDYGEIEGQPYYAMEYLDAGDLEERYKKDGPLAIPLAIKVLDQLLGALSCMHRAGLVHRDLKPSNVMIDVGGHITLMDFGLVKDLERTQLTAQGKLVGTPGYLSPEVILGKDVDGRADLFSLGILMYEVLCGTRPFGGDTLQGLLVGIVRLAQEPVESKRPDCPEWLARFVDRLLEKDPEARFPSAAAGLRALRLAQGKPVAQVEGDDRSVDRIVDYSGDVPLDGPVPQGSIEGGLKALSGLVDAPPPPEPPPSRPRRPSRITRPIPRVTPSISVAPPKPAISPVAAAAAVGVGVAVLVVGGWLALAPRPAARVPAPVASVATAAPVESQGIADLARALDRALTRLNPLEQIRQMHDDLERADRSKRHWFEKQTAEVRALHDRWQQRIGERCDEVGLSPAMDAFALRRGEYYTDPAGNPRDRLHLYLAVQQLVDLAFWCRRWELRFPVDPGSGLAAGFGQLEHSAMPDAPSVVLALKDSEHFRPEHLRLLAAPPGQEQIPIPEGERFYERGDVSEHDVVGVEAHLGGKKLAYQHPDPLPLPPLAEIAALEVCGWVSDMAINNRFVVSLRDDEHGWQEVAVLRGNDTKLFPVSHTVERALFSGSRLWVSIKFVVTPDMRAWSEYAQIPRLGLRFRRKG